MHAVIGKIQSYKKGIAQNLESAEETIEQILEKLKSVRAKYMEMLDAEDKLLEICRKRVEHIVETKLHSKDSKEVIEVYHLTRMDRVLLDYFLREGYFETARAIIKEAGLENFSDMPIFLENEEIAKSLHNHDIEPAIKWCTTHKTKLGNMKSTLEMELRIQEFVELIKVSKFSDAVAYGRKYLTKYMDEAPELMKRVVSLVAVHTSILEGLSEELYSDLLSQDRWAELADSFEKESYRLYSLTSEPLLSLILQAGLSSLKTVFCDDPNSKKDHCPTCSKLLGELAKLLPYSCHLHTSMVCKITGEVMDENNPPMMLPNGFVYSNKVIGYRL